MNSVSDNKSEHGHQKDVSLGGGSQDKKVSVSSHRTLRKKAQGAFQTIREVADLLGVQQHVLRFWETKFSYVRPLKRGGGRRYYRPEDVALLQAIHYLLYTEGYTIKGVQKLFRKNGKQVVLSLGQEQTRQPVAAPSNQVQIDDSAVPAQKLATALSEPQKVALREMLQSLKDIRTMIEGDKV